MDLQSIYGAHQLAIGQTVPRGALNREVSFCRGRAQNTPVSLLSIMAQLQCPDMLQLALHFGSGNQRLPTEEQASSLVPRRRDLVMSYLGLGGQGGQGGHLGPGSGL